MSSVQEARTAGRFAYVTLVTSDGYVDGALVLLHSLRRTLTGHNILCLATPSTLSPQSLLRLHKHFDGVIETDLQLSDDHRGLSVLGRPDLRSTLTKIQLWDPALFGAWDALCYLDADTLVRQSIDDVFDRLYSWRESMADWKDGGLVAASPDTGWPDCFNSGVLVVAPGYQCHRQLMQRAATTGASFDGADQGLLNEQFSDWSASAPYRRLPFLYNATANVYYTYEPAMQRFGHDVRVVHFIGVSKPWHWNRTPGGGLVADAQVSERWRQLVMLWWHIHDEHVSGWRYWKGPFDKDLAMGKGYHHITEPLTPPPQVEVPQQQTGYGIYDVPRHQQHQPGNDDGTYAEPEHQPTDEVPDWDKDWSWANDRVHPFDYAYLAGHIDTPAQASDGFQQGPQQVQHHSHEQYHSHEQQVQHDQPQQHHTSSDDQSHGKLPQPEQQAYRQISESFVRSSSDDSSQQHGVVPDTYQQHYEQPKPQGPPEWMSSQRPWEDVAREGWMHHDEYQPHSYDQSFVERHIDQHQQPISSGYVFPLQEQGHQEQGHQHQEQEFVPRSLLPHQNLYEASQVVMEPQHHPRQQEYHHQQKQLQNHHHHQHHRSEHYQHPQHHEHRQEYQGHQQQWPSGEQYTEPHQRSHSMHNLGHHHHQYQGGHEGYNGEQQWYHDPSSSNAGPQYGQGGQHQRSPSQTQSIDHSSRSGDSPLYYPQPKTPIIVNPVAIWESSEEQARRRAWAQQVRAPMEASHATTDPILGHSQPEAAVAAAAWGGAPPAAEYAVPHVMDQIDSSQLPAETPWKISHVRQRNRSEDAGIPQAPGGMQFKEGVATESNARDAAGQFLQRWHEAVVARKLHSQIDGIDVERLEHGVPKFERGTDAIRLETTVSCEAEDSKGERTVYRFTLSSTLDIGGAAQQQQQQQQQQMPQMSTQPGPATPAGGLGGSQFVMPAEYGTGVGTTQQDIQHDVHAYYNPNTANGTVLADNEDANVTILRQPVNYEEPTISRRSSFVQQQPGSLRGIPQMVNRTASMGHIDQFAEADARYWKLHRQLIDIEMNQRRQDEASHIDEVQQDRRSSEGWDEVQSEKIDLRSPPTPTIRLKSTAGSTGFGSYRRPSAFSIADPATFQQQQPEEEMLPVPASRPQGRRLSAETTTRPSYTTLSPNAPVPMPLETSVGESPTKHGKRGDIGLTLKRRSKSSPRLAMENARYHAPTSPLAPAGNTTGSPLIGHSSGGGSDEGLQKPSPSGDSAKVSVTGSRSSRVPSRSRSFSALRKIATHNSAQAATIVSPGPRADPRKLKKPAKPVFLTSSSSEDEDDDKDGDEDDTARYFKSAIGRVPTPYPRGLLGKVNANDEDEGKVRSSEKPAEKPVKKEGVSAESMTLPLAAGGTDGGDSKFGHTRSSGLSETPGKQKMRPRINWGDEDDEPFPNDDDQSLDAQWLRIIKGGPPTRASVRPAGSSGSNTPQAPKANEHAEVEVQSEVNPKVSVVAIEDSAPETPAATKAEDEVEDIKVEGAMPVTDTAMAYKEEDNADEADEEELAPEVSTEAASAGEPEEPGLPETTDDVPISIPAITPPEQQPPRLRKRSSRSFPNLMDREFETISDSEADTSEMEIQQRFWSRAMKPSKSGSSTPHVPARRKSVVEMSHDISSEDLAAWMHWRDSTSPVGKPNREMVAAGNVNRAQQLITPPVSKGSDIDAVETLADREEDTATISGRCLDALTPHDELQLSMGRAYSKSVSAVGLQPEVPDTKVPTAADKVTVLVDPSTK